MYQHGGIPDGILPPLPLLREEGEGRETVGEEEREEPHYSRLSARFLSNFFLAASLLSALLHVSWLWDLQDLLGPPVVTAAVEEAAAPGQVPSSFSPPTSGSTSMHMPMDLCKQKVQPHTLSWFSESRQLASCLSAVACFWVRVDQQALDAQQCALCA